MGESVDKGLCLNRLPQNVLQVLLLVSIVMLHVMVDLP
jgi:hypothetical protein